MPKITKAEVAKLVLESCETVEQLKSFTNYQLAQLLKENVWAEIHVFSAHSDLIDECILRLERTL